MRKETEGVTEILIESARNEFLEVGFHDASLRRISAASGVSTNSIYTRFGDKKGLFTAIVKEPAEELMRIYLASIEKATHSQNMDAAEDADTDAKYLPDGVMLTVTVLTVPLNLRCNMAGILLAFGMLMVLLAKSTQQCCGH